MLEPINRDLKICNVALDMPFCCNFSLKYQNKGIGGDSVQIFGAISWTVAFRVQRTLYTKKIINSWKKNTWTHFGYLFYLLILLVFKICSITYFLWKMFQDYTDKHVCLLLGENSCKWTVLSISLNWSYSQIDKNIYNTQTAY